MKNHKEDSFHLGVKALILNPDNKILLLERNHPSKGIYWDIPGGRLLKGESQMDTLNRELKEEIGLDHIYKVHFLMMTLTDIRISAQEGEFGLIFSIFILNVSDSFQPILSDEHINFEWCTLLEASERLKFQYPNEFIKKLLSL